MASVQGLDPESKQRAERFALLIKTFRHQAVHPVFQSAGIPAPSLSKRKLAQVLGVSATLIHKYEQAEIDPWDVRFGLVVQISQLLGLDLAELRDYLGSGQPMLQLLKMAQSDDQALSA